MRTRLLLCVAAVLASSCIKRIAPEPGEDRTGISGVPVAFGQRGEVPQEGEVLWDFGDGATATGPQVTHAFGKAGVYTIVETIRDKDGKSRTARTHVVAAPRPLPMAVPDDVRAALLLPAPWKKVALHREIAGKLSLGAFFDEVARSVSEAAGFDALDARAAEANGFDPDKGAAFFTVPQDPEALVFATGTLDDAKALAAARRLLGRTRGIGRYSAGPFQLSDGRLADGTPILVGQNAAGDKVGVVQRFGYLYIRTAGGSDPLIALKSIAALPPAKGLAADPGFQNASRHVGTGDAVFYSRATDGQMRYSSELGSSAFAVLENPDFLQLRIWSQLRNLSGDQLVATFKPLKEPPDLAARLPSGASAYVRLSAAPDALWRQLNRTSPADAARLRDRVQEATGLDVEKDLLPSFAGNVGIAVYLDASSLIEAIMGEEVGTLDQSSFLVV
ncbi:MAG: PKD domain-containing protein, partial [Myxococcales bacterium]